MQTARIQRTIRRTAGRNRKRKLLAVLFFFLCLPYLGSLLAAEQSAVREPTGEEEFLTGALAAVIPGEYSAETVKAQAVILRSTTAGEGKNDLRYLTRKERGRVWQQDFEEYEEKFLQAVRETEGMVLTREGRAVSPPYFRLSAGKTRDGNQLWEDGRFSWCKSVDCPHDLEAEDYLQRVEVKKAVFQENMKQQGMELAGEDNHILLTRDSGGYVVSVQNGGWVMEGEVFRELWGLESACFTISVQEERVVFITKGVGHGLGFDQYAADRLAKKGADYQQLLQTFFEGLTLEKVE